MPRGWRDAIAGLVLSSSEKERGPLSARYALPQDRPWEFRLRQKRPWPGLTDLPRILYYWYCSHVVMDMWRADSPTHPLRREPGGSLFSRSLIPSPLVRSRQLTTRSKAHYSLKAQVRAFTADIAHMQMHRTVPNSKRSLFQKLCLAGPAHGTATCLVSSPIQFMDRQNRFAADEDDHDKLVS
jgi:hypothetical protein